MKVITIGRSSQNEVVLLDDKVSRHHCQIILHDDGHYSIADFGSTNGTFVNSQRITGEISIKTNDVIRIGNTTLPWLSYFGVGMPQRPAPQVQPQRPPIQTPPPQPQQPRVAPQPQRKSHALPIVLGIVGGVLLIGLIIAVIALNTDNGIYIDTPQDTICYEESTEPVTTSINNNVNINVGNNASTAQTNQSGTSQPLPATGYCGVDVTGKWTYLQDMLLFELTLYYNENGLLAGNYCTINGEHWMDCDDDNSIKEYRDGKVWEKNTIHVKYHSVAWGGSGTAVIKKISNNKIQWRVLSSNGDGRVLDNVTLKRE